MRLGMQGKIVILYSLLILFAMQLSGVYLVNSLENYYLRNYANSQLAQGELLGSFIRRYLVEDEQGEVISTLIGEFGGGMPGTETMVLDRHGRLLAGPDQMSLSLLGGRVIQDDVLLALSGNRVEAIRVDPQTGIRYYFLALPVKNEAAVVGVVFLRGSLESIYHTLQEIKFMLISGWLIVLGIAVVIGFLLARTITLPIREVTSRAAAMAGGDFSQLIEVRSEDEIGELGKMFNFLTSRLQDTLKEISSEKSKIEAILNYMTDGIVAFNRFGKAIHLNPSAKKILQQAGSPAALGLPGEVILSKFFNLAELSELLQGTSPVTKEVQIDIPQEKTLQVHFAPIKEENEVMQGMLVVLHDVTGERVFSRMQQEFVANVSHELRTPLTTIKNYVETLLNGAQEEPGVRLRFLQVVEKETERMVKLVKDLLDLSQLDYQQTSWVKEEVDLVLLLCEVLEQVELACKAKNILLQRLFPGEALKVYVHKDKIRQVLLIILDNAIKYTAAGGMIEVRIFKQEKQISVSVKDTGIGIPAEELHRVFERFFRVDKTRSRDSGGTGLGLSIAKQIVEAHGGAISLNSKLGEGTEVIFSLPL